MGGCRDWARERRKRGVAIVCAGGGGGGGGGGARAYVCMRGRVSYVMHYQITLFIFAMFHV